MTNYQSVNRVKGNFTDVYHAPTPHAYFAKMRRLGYAIGQNAKPYFRSMVGLMRRQLGPDIPVRMLDLGCSYGVGSALVKYDLSFGKIADFFENEADREYQKCVKDTQNWLEEEGPQIDVFCAGADASAPAIKFASEAGLVDGGIARNLEVDRHLTTEENSLLQQCNLLISTGAIGYVGKNTLSTILSQLGKASALPHGPYAVVTILRMFSPDPVAETFGEFDYRFERVPGVRLRQRQFHNEKERTETLRLLEQRDVDPEGWESTGSLYADLFVGAPEGDFANVLKLMEETHRRLEAKLPAST